MASDSAASEEESAAEFSASEDEWNPDEDPSGAKSNVGRKSKAVAKRTPVRVRATRASRRIASRLGKEVPVEESEPTVPNLPEDESSDEEGLKKSKRKKRSPAKRGCKPKKPPEDEPIKLTTFTVEELYRKYRPDLAAGPSDRVVAKKRKGKVKREGDEDDDSSGDDYLVDPAELDLDSEFFASNVTKVMEKSDRVSFDCNVGLNVEESEEEVEETNSSEINKKLIQQINQSNMDCMNMLKLAEVSKQSQKDREENENKQEENVSNLLLAGEKIKDRSVKKSGRTDFVAVSVEEKHKKPEKSVEITLKLDTVEQSKQPKKKLDLITAIKRLMNREKRQNQIYLHKVSILCWIGHGTYLHKVLSDPTLQEIVTKKLLPSADCRPKGQTNLIYFGQLTRYFRKVVKLKNHSMYFRSSSKLPPLTSTLKYQIMQRAAFSKRDYILLYLLMLRSLSIHSRLVISLAVPPKHIPTSDLYRMNPQESDARLLEEFRRSTASPKGSTIDRVKHKINILTQKNSEQTRREAARRRRREGFCSTTIPQLDGGSDLGEEKVPRKKLKLMEGSFLDIEQNVVPKVPNKKSKKEEEEPTFPDQLDDEVRRRREKILAAYRASKEQKELAKVREDEEHRRRMLCGECSAKKRKVDRSRPGVDLWIEVFCEHEDKWVTIDVVDGRVHCLEDVVVS